jgi:hypothetical protein
MSVQERQTRMEKDRHIYNSATKLPPVWTSLIRKFYLLSYSQFRCRSPMRSELNSDLLSSFTITSKLLNGRSDIMRDCIETPFCTTLHPLEVHIHSTFGILIGSFPVNSTLDWFHVDDDEGEDDATFWSLLSGLKTSAHLPLWYSHSISEESQPWNWLFSFSDRNLWYHGIRDGSNNELRRPELSRFSKELSQFWWIAS